MTDSQLLDIERFHNDGRAPHSGSPGDLTPQQCFICQLINTLKTCRETLKTVRDHHNDPAMQKLYGTSSVIQDLIDKALNPKNKEITT